MKHFNHKALLSAGASALVLSAIALSAHAQDATPSATAAASDDTVVIVTARRKALQSATDRKKASDTMIDSVVADEAGQLPDNSITEVLQRVSGVTMVRFAALNDPDHFSVEGSGIQVRGLSNPTGLLNGREIFSANGGSGLSWGEVTPELMAAVDVYKATRADMIEGGTGGAIDLRTKMPFDYKNPSLEGSISMSHGDLIHRGSPAGSILWTHRFDTPIGEMGFLVDAAYSKFLSQDSFIRSEPYLKRLYNGQTRYIPTGVDWGDDHFQRERTGLYEAFQWRPNDSLTIFQTMFISNYKNNNNGAGVFVANQWIMPTSGAATFDDNGMMVTADHMSMASLHDGNAGSTVGQGWLPADQQVDCNAPYGAQAQSLNWNASPPSCSQVNIGAGSNRAFSTNDNTTRDFSQGFTWIASDKTRVKGALQIVDSSASSTVLSAGFNAPVDNYSVDLSGELPKFTINNATTLDEQASYGWGFLQWRPTNNHGTMAAINLDVDHDLGDGFFKSVSAGVRYAGRVEHDNYDGTYWEPFGNGWDGSPQHYLTEVPGDSEAYTFDGFFHGAIGVPHNFYVPASKVLTSGDYAYLMNTYGYWSNKTLPDGTSPTTPFQSIHVNYGASRTGVTTESAYVQTKFGSDSWFFGIPFDGNIGLRFVKTTTNASGNFVFSANKFYMTQADANADYFADPTGTLTPHAVNLTAAVTPRSAETSDTRVLPAFNINFKPSSKFYIRLAANQTVSRPTFNDVTVSGNGFVNTMGNTNNYTDSSGGVHTFLGVFNGVGASMGNPYLVPTTSTNYDLSVEWYPSQSLNTHVSLFHKDLKDLIVYGDTHVDFPYSFTKQNGDTGSGTTTLNTTQATNSSKIATISGLELGGRKFLDELPGFWSGFGVEANFTYIDSHNPAPKAYDVEGQKFGELPVVGMSKYSYNVQFLYSKGPVDVRLAYNWRSRYLQSTSANGTGTGNGYQYCSDTAGSCGTQILYSLPVYGDDYGQWDFGFNYKFSPHIKGYIQANNFTNAITRTKMEELPGKLYTRSWFVSDRRVDFGLNFAF